ncbi:MAG: RNA polymerase factor sigma-54 [Phycisphaerae bacterium]|nr:RNA polymerase factor sigma-54 [Saprospiraceae bacterium]
MIRQSQHIGQKQTLNLSPQQIQLLNFIQLGTLELEQRIEQETLENTALESDAPDPDIAAEMPDELPEKEGTDEADNDFERFEIIEQYQQEDGPEYDFAAPDSRSNQDESYQRTLAQAHDFREQLKAQISVLPLTPRAQLLAGYIVDSLDDDGYLRTSIADMTDTLSFAQSIFVEESEVEAALETVQMLEPAGIAARDLRECLLLQLDNLSRRQNNVEMAWRIVKDHLYDLGNHQHEKIGRVLGVSHHEIRDAAALIKKLNPRPVAGQSVELTKNYNIIPEFVVEKDEQGDLQVYLPNKNSGVLRVSAYMQEMLQSMQRNKEKLPDKAAFQYLRSKVDSAVWFVEMVRQREHSMLVTMQAIVQLQHEYFQTGDHRKLRPMILKDVAEIAQLDISTVSRVTSLKYVHTDFGTIHLKDLFQQGMAKADGEMVTNKEISELIAILIGEEDKQAPVSDQHICNILQDKGYNLARRTVAKYRDLMNIPIAKMRREMAVPATLVAE